MMRVRRVRIGITELRIRRPKDLERALSKLMYVGQSLILFGPHFSSLTIRRDGIQKWSIYDSDDKYWWSFTNFKRKGLSKLYLINDNKNITLIVCRGLKCMIH